MLLLQDTWHDSHRWPQHKGRKKKSGALASGHILKEKRDAKWNADWKEEKINQASQSDWQLAKVFSVEVSKNSTIALPRPPSLFLFPSLSLSHPSLASSPIITLSSPPKRLTKLPQYLSHFSLHCSSSSAIPRTPSHFLSQSLSHFPRRDAFIVSHLRLQTDTPLILLFCNLQRERKSCFTCVTFKQLPQPILYPQHFPITQLQWSSCFVLFVFIIVPDTLQWQAGQKQSGGKRQWATTVAARWGPAQH